jgi:hypothetical protein
MELKMTRTLQEKLLLNRVDNCKILENNFKMFFHEICPKLKQLGQLNSMNYDHWDFQKL